MRQPMRADSWTLFLALAAAGLACGEDDAFEGDVGSVVDARDAGDVADAIADSGETDLRTEDAGDVGDAASGDVDPGDGGLFVPGDPPTGSPELEIFAAQSQFDLVAQSLVVQGSLLLWECGLQAVGIGHVWASFRLATPELEGLSTEQQIEIEQTASLQLIDRQGFVIADNEALGFGLDFSVAGELRTAGPTRMILNRAVVGQTTRPSNVDGEIVRYRVRVPIPGGSTFEREAWVDTLVPDSQSGC